MNEISCEICMDLMPLVQDGVASPDSIAAVERHIDFCPACRAYFEGPIPQPADSGAAVERLRSKIRLFAAMVLMFGIFLGLSLTAGSELFHNVLIMPVIGAIGYYLFRWKSVLVVPGLLLVMHLVINALGIGVEPLDLPSLLLWTGIYSIFAVVGIAIAALLHFALK